MLLIDWQVFAMSGKVNTLRETFRQLEAIPEAAPEGKRASRLASAALYTAVFAASVVATIGIVVVGNNYWHGAKMTPSLFSQSNFSMPAPTTPGEKNTIISLGGGGASSLVGRLYEALLGNGAKKDNDFTASPDRDAGWFTLAFNSRPAASATPMPSASPAKASGEGDDAELEFGKAAANRLAALAAENGANAAPPARLVTPKQSGAPRQPQKQPVAEVRRKEAGANVERLGASSGKAAQVAIVTREEESLRTAIQQARQDFRFIDAAEEAYKRFQATLPAEPLLLLYGPKMEELAAIKREAARERSKFHLVADRMSGVDIGADRESQISRCFDKVLDVRAGLVARKDVAIMPNVSAYVALIDAPADFARRDQLEREVNACLSPLSIDGTVSLLFHFNAPASRALATAMNAVPGVFSFARD